MRLIGVTPTRLQFPLVYIRAKSVVDSVGLGYRSWICVGDRAGDRTDPAVATNSM